MVELSDSMSSPKPHYQKAQPSVQSTGGRLAVKWQEMDGESIKQNMLQMMKRRISNGFETSKSVSLGKLVAPKNYRKHSRDNSRGDPFNHQNQDDQNNTLGI